MNAPIMFNGSIPQNYQDYLTPFLFLPYAIDLVQRIEFKDNDHILELACGTGCVTNELISLMPSSAHLTATDLQSDMLQVARQGITAPNVSWKTVDMTDIPFEAETFDLIVCQFGVMLVPEKLKALKEMNRVLKKNGRIIFNVWANINDNPVWNIGGKIIDSFIGANPITQDPGPFSLNESHTLRLLEETGFHHAKATTVNKTGSIATAAMAAKGFIEGLPVYMAINKKDSSLVPKIQKQMERELIEQLGNNPLRSPLQALVFEAVKE